MNIENSTKIAYQHLPVSEGFCPPWYLHNTHLQALLSSSPLRKKILAKQHSALLANAETHILEAGNGVRLCAELNRAPTTAPHKTLITLLHGWEGSSKSNYIVSAAANLVAAGYDVCRLNFRDHGDSHHLNRGIFNSTLVDEVGGAIKTLQESFSYDHFGLMGFSLGGNFALRVGLLNTILAKPLDAVLAVCPVFDPAETMKVLENGPFWYEKYFVQKWKRSLFKKLEHFPDYGFAKALAPMKSLREMNDYFIPRFTGFDSVADYFQAYTITGHKLAFTTSKTCIIAAADDPVIPANDVTKIARPARLSVTLQQHGSHCAFLRGFTKPSWADQYAVSFFTEQLQ